MVDQRTFDGLLLEVPFGSETIQSVAKEQYRTLLNEHNIDDVLVLTGSPTSMAAFRDVLDEECPGSAVPHVSSVIVHATDVVNRMDDRAVLSDAMRQDLAHRFVAGWEWESEYFKRAAEQESFTGDIAELIEAASWQNASFDVTPELKEIAVARDAFHAWLGEHGHMERSQLISEATDLLAATNAEKRADVLGFDAILVVEFEEFVDQDRRYLQCIAENRELVCISERDSSVRRTRSETEPITEHVSFTEQRTVDGTIPASRPAALADYFAQGVVPNDPEAGDVQVLAAETAEGGLHRVVDEIERVCEGGVAYEDVAVAVKHSGESVNEVMRAFQQAGIPTASATVVGFGDDPVIRELVQVVEELANDDAPDPDPDTGLNHGVAGDEGLTLVNREVFPNEDVREVVAETSHIGDALRRWATVSGVKERVASDSSPLEVRSQFGNLRQAFAIADFVEETSFDEASWGTLAGVLKRAHEYEAQERETSAIDETGVRVDHVRTLKNGSFDVVFVLDIVDSTYPGDPTVSRVFSEERVLGMPDYPGVTQVSDAAVDETFATTSTRSSRAFRRYHAEHARRLLGVGASIASDRVYLCFHTHEGTALDERVHPSRYLSAAYREVPWLTEADERAITSDRAAEEFLMGRIDRALAEVRRTNSQDVTVALDDVEAEFAEIQELLDASGERGEELRAALQARLDFVSGRVARE